MEAVGLRILLLTVTNDDQLSFWWIASFSVGNGSKNSWEYHARQKIIHNSVKTYDILIK